MFLLPLPKTKIHLDLRSFKNLDDKLKALYKYTKIKTVFCDVSNIADYDSPQPKRTLQIRQIAVLGGTPSYLKSRLTDCEKQFAIAIKKLLHSKHDFESISLILTRCMDISVKAVKETNFNNAYTKNEKIDFKVYSNKRWRPVLFSFLVFDKMPYIDFREHVDIRRDFYNELLSAFLNAFAQHRQKPDLSKKPYSWDSKSAELEATELLYLLVKKSELIKIDSEAGGSFAKLKKEFFGLFGLSDKRYDQNVSEIRKRKKDKHFIDRLAELMPNTAPKPPEKQ
jgi:hypothetical protein